MNRNRIDDESNLTITADSREEEWQCIECGTVVELKRRPKHCPHCNCVNGDFGPGVNVMARREAVGWFK